MKRLKIWMVLLTLQIFPLCGGLVSAGGAQTLVNVDNRVPFSVDVTVTCMQCSYFGWGSDSNCWNTGNNVSGSVPPNTTTAFKCAEGERIFIRDVFVRSDRLNKECSFVPPENMESTWHVTLMIGSQHKFSCTQ